MSKAKDSRNNSQTSNTHLLLWLLLVDCILVIVSSKFELGVDEAHYVLYGMHLDWSYFDHPPLVGWIQFLFQKLPLSLEIRSRLPAILSINLSAILVCNWLKQKGYSPRSAMLAAGLLPACLLFEALGLFLLPDTPLLFLFPAIAIVVNRILIQSNFLNWLSLGILLGLSGLSKYTAILLVIALAIEWARAKRLSDFKQIYIYFSASIAVLMILPILIWNARHDWMSFKYQSGHVIGLNSLSLTNFLGPQLSQWAGWGFIYFASLLFLRKQAWGFEKILILVVLFFMFFFGLFGNFLPHWPAPVMVLLIPWATAELFEAGEVSWGWWLAIPISIIVNAELIFHFLPENIERQIYRDIQGWKSFSAEVESIAEKDQLNLGVLNWSFGSRFLLYSKRPEQFFVLDHRTDQFDLWNTQRTDGLDFLILHEPSKEKDFRCKEEEVLGTKPVHWKDMNLMEFELIKCRGFHWQ